MHLTSQLIPSSSSLPQQQQQQQEQLNFYRRRLLLHMEMDCEMVDTGLVLGLGYGGRSCSSPSTHKLTKGSPSLIITHTSDSKEQLLPSLTLGLDHHHHHHHGEVSVLEDPKVRINPSSPQSMASSLSNSFQSSINKVKRERDVVVSGGGHDEERPLSSRISDEEEDANGKKKLRLTKDQSALLEDRFKEHSTLNPKQKVALAKQLNLRPRQVEVWFQNRRARTKLKQTEVDCEVLRRCCETLRDENRRLKNELQQLKSVKISPTTPLYMQINVCPSCERINGTNTTAAGDDSGEAPTPNFVVAQKPLFFNSFPHSSSSAAC